MCIRDRLVVLLGDAARPDRGVVGRHAAERDDPAGLHVQDDRGRAVGPGGVLHGVRERLVDDLLHVGVHVGDQDVARRRGGLPLDAEDLAHAVDLDPPEPRRPAQRVVVDVFEPVPADEVDAGEVGLERRPLLQLGLGDRLQVAEGLRRPGAEGILPHGLHLGDDPGEVLLTLQDLQRLPGGDVVVDGDRRVERARPARTGHVGPARADALAQLLDRAVEHRREPLQHGHAAVAHALDLGAVDRDDQRGAVAHQRAPAGVQDLPAHGRDDHVAGAGLGRRRHELAAAHDLHLPQPYGQDRQQGQHEELQHHQPGADPDHTCLRTG